MSETSTTNETKIKEKSFLKKVWTDPVLSKVISVLVIAVLTILYSFIESVVEKISFKEAILNTIYFKIEVYKILLIILFASIILLCIFYWRKHKKKTIGSFDIDQKVGNFTFRELYNALLTHKIDTDNELQDIRKLDLLNLFIIFQRPLNMGAEWQTQDFLYYRLGPILMSYGLTEKIPTTDKNDTTGSEMIQTSKVGYEFLSLLERWRVHNDTLAYEKEVKTNKKAD